MDSEDKGCFIIATILIILFFGAMMLNDWYKYDVDKKAIEINSKLVSAQNRRRLYWSNIPCKNQPADKLVLASSIKETADDFHYAATIKNSKTGKVVSFGGNKMPTLTTFCGSPNGLGRPLWTKEEFVLSKPFDYSKVKRIIPIEAERLQTVPDNYTSCISDNKRYHALGNGWTVDVIAHIFSSLPEELKNG